MKKQGVEFYVCGQDWAGEKIDPRTLVPDVTVAADALLVLDAISEQRLRPAKFLNFNFSAATTSCTK